MKVAWGRDVDGHLFLSFSTTAIWGCILLWMAKMYLNHFRAVLLTVHICDKRICGCLKFEPLSIVSLSFERSFVNFTHKLKVHPKLV